jgi:SAM-dependent methyltransferase
MSFEVAAEAYDRFMGRFSRLLSPQMADVAGVRAGQAALDVGCGTGMLTAVLVDRLGAANVTGIDPSESFVAAARERFPGVRIEQGSAEALPFDDDAFDVAIAQLVVHFMSDPVGGVREMRRVTRHGGVVAACVWDHAGGTGPVSLFWRAVQAVQPGATDEGELPGTRAGHLVEIFQRAGLTSVEGSTLTADLEMESFAAYWEPFSRGVGPAGAHLAKLDASTRTKIERQAREVAGPEPFVIPAKAWVARGVA